MPTMCRVCLSSTTRGGVMSVSYDKTSTLRSQTKHHEPVVLVYESHGQDCRYTPLGDTCSTISQKRGKELPHELREALERQCGYPQN